MAWDGFLPKGVTCKKCGAVLQGQGEGRPAESYMGTYTGLCYKCTELPPHPTEDIEPSGATWYSHAPSCPSWRRNRSNFLFFPDCTECNFGTIRKYSPGPFGGSFPGQCDKCSERHYGHPIIRAQAVSRAKRSWKGFLFASMAEKLAIQRGCPIYSTAVRAPFKDAAEFTPGEKAILDEVSSLAIKLYKEMDDSLDFPTGYPTLTAAEYKRLVSKSYGRQNDVPEDYMEALKATVVTPPRRKKSQPQ